MKPYELARLIKAFYDEWNNRNFYGPKVIPSLLDFGRWLENQDTNDNPHRYKV